MSAPKNFSPPETYRPRLRWTATVLCWDAKTSFGKPKELPYTVTLECWAATEEEARVRLNALAEGSGYGLGGISNVYQIDKPKKAQPKEKKSSTFKAPARKKMTELDRFLAQCSPEVLANLLAE